MLIKDFKVTVSPSIAVELIVKKVTDKSVTGKVIDTYSRRKGDLELIVLIMEKFYIRASRVAVTVTLDNFDGGETAVHIISSGGVQGLLPIDWGAGENFVSTVEQALASYKVREG